MPPAPESFQYAGEYRVPRPYEWWHHPDGKALLAIPAANGTSLTERFGYCIILAGGPDKLAWLKAEKAGHISERAKQGKGPTIWLRDLIAAVEELERQVVNARTI
jgi:hypothetical protein